MDYYTSSISESYRTLHDVMDMEMSADVDMFHEQNALKSQSTAPHSTTHMNQDIYNMPTHNEQMHYNGDTHYARNGMTVKMEPSSPMSSNLSWLQSITNSTQHHDSCNPNLVVNSALTTSSAPPVQNSSLTSKILSLPNNVQISGGNVNYVSLPASTQQVYITTNSKAAMATQQQPPSGSINQGYRQQQGKGSYMLSPTAAAPTSTVLDNPFPKPAYSYSCLIAMALKNSKHGSLPVAEIYNFMIRHFPYFKTAPDGWKNSVRHNLSLNKCFEKIENPNADGTNSRKGCLWALNPAKMKKMDEEIGKWNKKDPAAITRAMAHPEVLEMLEKGQEAYLNVGATKQTQSHTQILHSSMQHQPVHQMQQQQSSPHHSPAVRVIGASPLMTQTAVGQPMSSHLSRLPTNHNMGQMQGNHAGKMSEDCDNGLYSAEQDFALDPSLSEINIQSGIWDDLPSDIFDLPMTHSPTFFQITPLKKEPLQQLSPGVPMHQTSALSPVVNSTSMGTLITMGQQ